ncbi:MAG: hypothetical protein V4662_21475 [Verrucomicrobiota bacterium]
MSIARLPLTLLGIGFGLGLALGISAAGRVQGQTPAPVTPPASVSAPAAVLAPGTATAAAPAIAGTMGSPAVDASSPDSRLRQLEAIYQQQLRARHIPLLGKHLTELQLAARSAPGPAWQQEILRVQSVISAGGVVNLTAAARELNPAVPAPVLPPMPDRPRRVTLMLTPSLAQTIDPKPESSASPVGAAIGQLTWRIESLPAGEYDLVLHYASVVADTEVPVSIEFAGQKLTQILEAGQTTQDGKNFRLLRLGQIKLDTDVSGVPLVLTAGTVTTPALIVRNLVIGRARKP